MKCGKSGQLLDVHKTWKKNINCLLHVSMHTSIIHALRRRFLTVRVSEFILFATLVVSTNMDQCHKQGPWRSLQQSNQIYIFKKDDYQGIYTNCKTLRDFKQTLQNGQKLQACLARQGLCGLPCLMTLVVVATALTMITWTAFRTHQNKLMISKSDNVNKIIFG